MHCVPFVPLAASHVNCFRSTRPSQGKKAINVFTHSHLLLLRIDGARIASSTGIDILLLDDFKLVINDTTHFVRPPRRGESSGLHFSILLSCKK